MDTPSRTSLQARLRKRRAPFDLPIKGLRDAGPFFLASIFYQFYEIILLIVSLLVKGKDNGIFPQRQAMSRLETSRTRRAYLDYYAAKLLRV